MHATFAGFRKPSRGNRSRALVTFEGSKYPIEDLSAKIGICGGSKNKSPMDTKAPPVINFNSNTPIICFQYSQWAWKTEYLQLRW